MGILDDAIREHLELKRQHGAPGDDLRKIEQEAFGPADEDENDGVTAITDEAAEAPTQFLSREGVDEATAAAAAPDPPVAEPEAPIGDSEPLAAEPGAQEPEPIAEDPPPPPAAPEQDATEHAIPAAEAPPEDAEPIQPREGPDTEERHAIAEQPTELFDVQAELSAGQESPSDEEILEEETVEPKLSAGEPAGLPDDGADMGAEAELAIGDDEDFFNEQTLSDELDQALDSPELGGPGPAAPATEAPVEESPAPEPPEPDMPEPEPELEPDPEPEPEYSQSEPEEEEALPEPESYQPLPPEPGEPEPAPEADEGESGEAPAAPADQGQDAEEGGFYDQDEDVLEETPEFLQDTPEHDRLWFEQKPPKDFDFDD